MKVQTSRFKEAAVGYLFLTPNLLGFVIFTAFPVIGSLLISFSDWNLINNPSVVGMSNYQHLLHDPVYWQSMVNTIVYSFVSVLFNIIAALALAMLLNKSLSGTNLFRAAYFFPAVYSSVAIALIWQWLFDYQMGLLNHILAFFKLAPFPWLISPGSPVPLWGF